MTLCRRLLIFPLIFVLSACNRAPKVKPQNEEAKIPQEKLLEIAVDQFRKAGATADFREALTKVAQGKSLSLQLSAQQRRLLQERFQVADEEINEIEALTFQPLDAHHVEFCYLLRDAARTLEIQPIPQEIQKTQRFFEKEKLKPAMVEEFAKPWELEPDELEKLRKSLKLEPEVLEKVGKRLQAKRSFAWVMRQVILRERDDDLLPPAYVLRRGWGTAAERALVFLALLQQVRLDGCLVALPGKAPGQPGPLVVGVLAAAGNEGDVYLFDPRLGRPLPGPGGQGIATLTQVRQNPALFWPAGAAAEVTADVEVFLACPLHALSPRMKELEKILKDHGDKVVLAQDPEALRARLEAAAGQGKVQVWNQPAKPGGALPVSPLRALRAFLPVAEQGADKTGRMKQAEDNFFTTWATVLFTYGRLQLLDLPFSSEMLRNFSRDFYTQYVYVPRNSLLRGQYEQARARLEILHNPLNMDLGNEYPEAVRRFRKRAQEVDLALTRKEPNAKEHQLEMWADTYFFLGLLQAQPLYLDLKEVNQETGKPKNVPRDVSFVVLGSIREPMNHELAFLQAQIWREQAIRAQTRLEGGGPKGGENPAAVQAQWQQCVKAWTKYETFGLSPAILASRLKELFTFLKRGDLNTFFLTTEQIFADLHKSASARWALAEALQHSGQGRDARGKLQVLANDLAALENHAGLSQCLDDAWRLIGGRPSPISGWQRDLGPHGGFAWLRRAVQLRLRE